MLEECALLVRRVMLTMMLEENTKPTIASLATVWHVMVRMVGRLLA